MASRLQLSTTNNKKPKAGQVLQIKVSPQERSYRNSLFPETFSIGTRLSCTKCYAVIKPRMISDKNILPVLEVLVCKKCRHFYDQRQASENPLYCKWCANEGHLHGCSTCCAKFCETCIKKHFRRLTLEEIKQMKWKCFCCYPKPIWDERAVCASAKNFSEGYNNELKDRISRCKASRGTVQHTLSYASKTSNNYNLSIGLTKISAHIPNQSLNADQKKRFTDTYNGEISKENISKHVENDGEELECVICLDNSL